MMKSINALHLAGPLCCAVFCARLVSAEVTFTVSPEDMPFEEKADFVSVSGTFNNWDHYGSRLEFDGEKYTGSFDIPDGEYAYKIYANGPYETWFADPNSLANNVAADFGMESKLFVKDGQAVVPSGQSGWQAIQLDAPEATNVELMIISYQNVEPAITMRKNAEGVWESWLSHEREDFVYNIFRDNQAVHEEWLGPDGKPTKPQVYSGQRMMPFRLDLDRVDRVTDPGDVRLVTVRGTFNSWHQSEGLIPRVGESAFEGSLPVYDGEQAYKFVAVRQDGRLIHIPDPAVNTYALDGYGAVNTLIEAKEGKVTKPEGTTAFRLRAPKADAVFLTGDFIDWRPDAVPMRRGEEEGIWEAHLRVEPPYRYRFVLDGRPVLDTSSEARVEIDPDHGPVNVSAAAESLRGQREVQEREGFARSAVNTGEVTLSPDPPRKGQPLTITYAPKTGPLMEVKEIMLYWGYDDFQDERLVEGEKNENGIWEYSVTVPPQATEINFVFNGTGGKWDNRGTLDWTYPVEE
ncbi:MAG: carbohydrate-binding protein [Sumerlaeia bacterium]